MLAAGPDPGAVAALEDEVRQQPPSAWRGFILAHLAMSAGHVGEATTRLEDALDRSDPDQEPEIVAITAFLLAACRLLQGGRGRETAELSRLALRLAPVGSPARLAWVTVLYGEAIAGRPTAALKMVPDLESLPPGVERAAVVLGRAMVRLYTDDLDGARDDLSQVQGAFVRDRPGPMTWPVCTNLAEVDFRAGRWDDALAHAELGISVATDMDDTLAVGFHSAIIAAIHAYRGEWSAAREAHAVIERQAAATGLGASRIHAAIAGVRIAHAREAADVLIEASRPLVELSGEDAVKEHGAFPWRDLRAEALVRLERFDEAEAMVDELERHGSQRRLRSAEVAAARVRGALEAARGHRAEARDAYQRGLEASLDLGMPLLRGLLLLDYGRFARRRGGRRDSIRLLDEAAEIFRGIGSEPFVERCVRELGATGRRRARRGESHLELTQQEYAVARLVMDGLSNREVAAELVISVKTVEYHLSNLYSKVGVASRTQLMARFGDGGLRIGRSS
jgi:ATP/maltotriose-dependent transcriptional regulator MalT